MTSQDGDALQAVVGLCSSNRRVCPQPTHWHELWQLLDEESADDSPPPKPLILSAWWRTSNIDKQLRVRNQLEWAVETGCLGKVATFLEGLDEAEWHHMGD